MVIIELLLRLKISMQLCIQDADYLPLQHGQLPRCKSCSVYEAVHRQLSVGEVKID